MFGVRSGQSELGKDRGDVLLDGAVGNDQVPGDPDIRPALSHQPEDFALARGQVVEWPAAPASQLYHRIGGPAVATGWASR